MDFVFKTATDHAHDAYVLNEGQRQTDLYERLTQRGKEAARSGTDKVERIKGTKIGVPEQMSDAQASQILARKAEAEQEEFVWMKDYAYRPWDGAVCTQRALRELFGSALTSKRGESRILEVPIDAHGNTEGVEFGTMELKWFGATIEIRNDSYMDDKIGLAHRVVFVSIAQHAPFLVGLSKEIEDYIKANSIYKNKSIILSNQETFPQFDDPFTVNPATVAYNANELEALNEAVIGLIKNAETLRTVNLPVTQQVLLAGEYGVGKTLALKMIAQECNNNGFTFIQAKTGEDNLELVKSFAQLYAPAYVAIEDADHLAVLNNDDDGKKLSKLLQEFDGASGKGKEIGIVMTTNNWDKFPAPMRRPGRLDDVIHFSKWDREAFARGVSSRFDKEEIGKVDWDAVWEVMEELTPAFIVSILDRTRSSAILRTGKTGQKLVTEDFLKVARLKARQWKDYLDAMEKVEDDPYLKAQENFLRDQVRHVLDRSYFDSEEGVITPL